MHLYVSHIINSLWDINNSSKKYPTHIISCEDIPFKNQKSHHSLFLPLFLDGKHFSLYWLTKYIDKIFIFQLFNGTNLKETLTQNQFFYENDVEYSLQLLLLTNSSIKDLKNLSKILIIGTFLKQKVKSHISSLLVTKNTCIIFQKIFQKRKKSIKHLFNKIICLMYHNINDQSENQNFLELFLNLSFLVVEMSSSKKWESSQQFLRTCLFSYTKNYQWKILQLIKQTRSR
ncbi:unnamed protein product (macronuclear) [Paramecium tetraurelia]|uniref:Uncharacterized protein n=1 Tax=Paramecium tetraurelia TaxID=5888 RepID=A0DJN8_PARTE|nr:uncharacterized protein GSPATT00017599001 [Paramecium tetraurelia]CAK83255.1 unnamed protein product [Paramecium tetraurelia]|eukprot:XP_001450652.1 hypothetical protein (macronuclear) [Paramecium tetraurelia strain d4-2]